MRTLRNPENYTSPKDGAKFLREIADDMEKKSDWVNINVNCWFATYTEVKTSLHKKQAKPIMGIKITEKA